MQFYTKGLKLQSWAYFTFHLRDMVLLDLCNACCETVLYETVPWDTLDRGLQGGDET